MNVSPRLFHGGSGSPSTFQTSQSSVHTKGSPRSWKWPIRPRYRQYRHVLCPPGKLLAEAGKLGRTYIRNESFKRQFRWSYRRHLFLDERFVGYCSFRSTRTFWNCIENIVDDEHSRFVINARFRLDFIQFDVEHVCTSQITTIGHVQYCRDKLADEKSVRVQVREMKSAYAHLIGTF